MGAVRRCLSVKQVAGVGVVSARHASPGSLDKDGADAAVSTQRPPNIAHNWMLSGISASTIPSATELAS